MVAKLEGNAGENVLTWTQHLSLQKAWNAMHRTRELKPSSYSLYFISTVFKSSGSRSLKKKKKLNYYTQPKCLSSCKGLYIIAW